MGTTAASCSAQDAVGNMANGGFNVTVDAQTSPPGEATLCGVLGDGWLLDADLYSFTAGESITVTLRTHDAGSHSGTSATLALLGPGARGVLTRRAPGSRFVDMHQYGMEAFCEG